VTVVVVTGASAGVGRASAVAFGREGAAVGLIARGAEGLEGARRDVERVGGRALELPADVAAADQVEEAAERVEAELGPIDVWVNNAMVTVFAPFSELEPDEFRRVTEVTYLGVVYGTMAALRRMGSRDDGTIVQVGSALAYRGIPLQAAYCGAKHAIVGFTESLRCELLRDGSSVRVSMVHLPGLNTPQFDHCRNKLSRKPQPVPPIYQPELAADAVLLAARTGRREIFVGWPTVATIVGNRFSPGLMDHYLARRAFDGQLTEEPAPPDGTDNLYEPVSGDPGAHGRFDHEAHDSSLQLQATAHRRLLSGLAGTLAAGMLRSRRGSV
jgi:NAD(P)-dependent dehydrogenase (short-subunit alcohol dehydrogenase family)